MKRKNLKRKKEELGKNKKQRAKSRREEMVQERAMRAKKAKSLRSKEMVNNLSRVVLPLLNCLNITLRFNKFHLRIQNRSDDLIIYSWHYI